MRDRSHAITSRLVAENGLYLPPSTSSGAPALVGADGIIFRPGGVAGGNVYTTWPAVMAALTAVQGATTVYVDSSIAPANVPPGVYNGFGPAKLACYNTEDVDILNITDGATLSEWSGINGLFVSCACVTTAAFSFSEFASFNLFDFATLSLAVGALVPAIQIATGPFSWALISRMGSVDNSNAPTVATISIAAGSSATFYIQCAGPNFSFLTTGDEIGGPVGATVIWENDDTTAALTSSLFLGTLNAAPTSVVTNATSGGAAAGFVATATGTGGVVWSPVGVAMPLTNVIFRPGGVAGGNVYTTWATAFAAATASQCACILYVDSSLAAATVPAGTWDCLGALTLAGYNVFEDTLTVADTGILKRPQAISGLTVECTCATTQALSFNDGDTFFLD